MSEEKKKLGVEDLVQAQRETAEQLKIIAERLDWICDAEPPDYNIGCGVFWWAFILFGVGFALSIDDIPKGGFFVLIILTLSVAMLVGLQLREAVRSPRKQRADRWQDEQYYKKKSASQEQSTSSKLAELERLREEDRQRKIASKPKIQLKSQD